MSSAPEPLGPGSPSNNPLRPVIRTVLFWLLMILLAVVLFKMSFQSKDNPTSRELSYSDFMQQVDKNNVAEGKFVMSQNTADFQGRMRNPAEAIRATVPREDFSALTSQLRQQGASIEIAENQPGDWKTALANFAPLILLVGFWVFMMKQMNLKRRQN